MIKLPNLAISVGLLVNAIEASPVYYTFTGTANRSTYAPIQAGDAVSYSFMVDLDQPGYDDNHGTISFLTDNDDYHSFRTDYVSGDAIPVDLGANVGSDQDDHLGIDYLHGQRSSLEVGSHYGCCSFGIVEIDNLDHNVANWDIGQTFSSRNFASRCDPSNNCQDVYVSSWVTLASISDTSPAAVPEPSALALFGLGLTCFGAVGHVARKRKRNMSHSFAL